MFQALSLSLPTSCFISLFFNENYYTTVFATSNRSSDIFVVMSTKGTLRNLIFDKKEQ